MTAPITLRSLVSQRARRVRQQGPSGICREVELGVQPAVARTRRNRPQ